MCSLKSYTQAIEVNTGSAIQERWDWQQEQGDGAVELCRILVDPPKAMNVKGQQRNHENYTETGFDPRQFCLL